MSGIKKEIPLGSVRARRVSELAGELAEAQAMPHAGDPRLKRLLDEMEALARILPIADSEVMNEDSASDSYFDNMPV
ncbi:MAG: hypothetical protein R3D84_09605 [Paracoccaceae bacterium]